jgi:hypothetical protein
MLNETASGNPFEEKKTAGNSANRGIGEPSICQIDLVGDTLATQGGSSGLCCSEAKNPR